MIKTIGYILFPLANLLSVWMLLWFLLGMNTYGNGIFTPDAVYSSPIVFAVWRIFLLQLETLVWLIVMFWLNKAFLTSFAEYEVARRISLICFGVEYLVVTVIMGFFFYNTLTTAI